MVARRSQPKVQTKSSNLPGEIFAFIAGIIGFIVDTVGLIGLISGFVKLPTGSFLANNPFTLAVVSLCSIVYSLALLLYVIRTKVRRRWHEQNAVLSKDADQAWMNMAGVLLWVPIFLLWSIAIWGAGVNAGYEAPGIAIGFLTFCFFGLLVGAECLCDIVRNFDMALNPGEDLAFQEARHRAGWNTTQESL